MTDVVAFLRARFNEDEVAWRMVAARDVAALLNGELIAPRMLADVEAKRRIVDVHEATMTDYLDAPPERSCRRCGKADEYPVAHPCSTLRLLALPYADHPDYDESWRP